ncbi:MBL fold metallo-hydrolase [bacterium]|nr:MBL fold metallo-hydrolase [candidate division CSSED10-310 bacterium]
MEIDNGRFLVDCGVRMKGDERLPDLARLQDGKPLTAIIVTHAHLDHTGALPALVRAFPTTPVYMTPPTFELTRILLMDSIKIMQSRWHEEREVPLYGEAAVAAMLQAVTTVPFGQRLALGPDCRMVFFPAGHIAGAAAIGLRTVEGNVFFSGDFSIDEQLTVGGMAAPRFKPHVLVTEATYGGRLHASRKLEERRLVERVAETVASGGKVLIPAFALGRAQEIILILRRAMAAGTIPAFPVHVDGMVRNICATYSRFPLYLATRLRREINKWGDPFFGVLDAIKPVVQPDDRRRLVEGPPCCIVTSSGMLTGGPSLFYAALLAGDKANLIAITGYQDEEAPGRKLMAMASGAEHSFIHEGSEVTVNCAVETYALSAHADSGQIAGLAAQLTPREVVLVHGDAQARDELAALIRSEFRGGLHKPRNGEALLFRPRRSRVVFGTGPDEMAGIGGEAALDFDGLRKVVDLLRGLAGRSMFSVQEILEVWYGFGRLTPEITKRDHELIEASGLFKPDRRKPFLYLLADPENVEKVSQRGSGPWEQNRILGAVRRKLPKEAGLYKAGALLEDGSLVLSFFFPKVASELCKPVLEELEKESGWRMTINPETHQGALSSAVREMVPAAWGMVKTPSIHREKKEVQVLLPALPDAAAVAGVREAFKARTGYDLVFQEATAKIPVAVDRFMPDGCMEINATFAAIDRAFMDQAHKPYKKSRKTVGGESYIELAFISKAVGERYLGLMEEVSGRVCWQLRVAEKTNQAAVLELARELLQPLGVIKKGPSYRPGVMQVAVNMGGPVPAAALQEVRREFQEASGLELVFE